MRILLAEDDRGSRLLLERTLVNWHYEVVVACDGNEAWQVLQSEDAPPLALLDWMMPGMDGVEVCRKVRESSRAPYVYIVILTAKTTRQSIVEAMEAGADDYVHKPFDRQELQVRLQAGRRIVELQQALRLQATHDALTGLWNRAAILDLLQREVAQAARGGMSVGVLMADLDHFKQVNDTYGHVAGDAVLREAADRMRKSLRAYDVVGRYGGEEFLIVLSSRDAANMLDVAERVRLCIAQAPIVTAAGGTIPITVSLGGAVADPGRTTDAESLIQAADAAMYCAKRNGRNRAEFAVHLTA